MNAICAGTYLSDVHEYFCPRTLNFLKIEKFVPDRCGLCGGKIDVSLVVDSTMSRERLVHELYVPMRGWQSLREEII